MFFTPNNMEFIIQSAMHRVKLIIVISKHKWFIIGPYMQRYIDCVIQPPQ